MLRNHGKGCCTVPSCCEAGLLDIRVLRASPALFHGGARRSPSNWHPHGFNGEVNPVLRPSRMEDQKLERLQMRHDIAWEVLRLVQPSGQGEHRRSPALAPRWDRLQFSLPRQPDTYYTVHSAGAESLERQRIGQLRVCIFFSLSCLLSRGIRI